MQKRMVLVHCTSRPFRCGISESQLVKIVLKNTDQRFPVLSSRNRNTETLGSGLGIVSESESSSKHVESRNWNRNRVLKLCSIGTGIGTEIIARVVPESESESGFRLTHKKHINWSYNMRTLIV